MSEPQAIIRRGDVLVWEDGTLIDADSLDAYTEEARMIAHPLDSASIRTPDWVIDALNDASRWAARMVAIIATAEEIKRQKSGEYQDARAQAVIDTAGYPAREQASRVRIATVAQRQEYDRAVVAFEKARRVGNLLSDYTSRLQSIGKQIEITYRHGGLS
ncbi:hypothetical protein [uncultured Microbacterium sp.]|uniref:hypothetical protein n=1 Tax=uncultured Microbacterium sp. TaxID=191216 RepID=UPI0025DF5E98|nr:hypothetical protein [uncultured Microbacterium sp.]